MTLVPFYILTPRFRFFFFLSFLLRGTLPDLLLRYATPKYREIQRSLLVNVNKDLPGKKVKRKRGENKSKRTKRKKKHPKEAFAPWAFSLSCPTPDAITRASPPEPQYPPVRTIPIQGPRAAAVESILVTQCSRV